MRTPWGESDNVVQVAEGIQWVTTPGHGGYKLTPEKVKEIPPALVAASFNRQGYNGWFEEDCDWAMVCLTFPEIFEGVEKKGALEAALRTVQYFKSDEAKAEAQRLYDAIMARDLH